MGSVLSSGAAMGRTGADHLREALAEIQAVRRVWPHLMIDL